MNKLVKAAKGREIRGSLDLAINGERRHFRQANMDDLLAIVYRAMGARIRRELGCNVTLIPVPSSAATLSARSSFPSLRLAQGIAAAIGGGADAIPALLWRTKRPPAHRGCRLTIDRYHEKLALVACPLRPVVLVDDVIATGAQMSACWRRLVDDACIVPALGVTVARVVREPSAKVIEWQRDTIPIRIFA